MDFTTTTHQRDLLHILHTHREISVTFNSSLTNETTLSTHHSQLHSTQYTTNHSHSIHITYTHYTTTPNTISNISTQILLKLNGKNQWQNHTSSHPLSHNSQIASYPITNHITFFILHTITTTILHNTSILIPPSLIHHTTINPSTTHSLLSSLSLPLSPFYYYSTILTLQLHTFLHTTIHTLLYLLIIHSLLLSTTHQLSIPSFTYQYSHHTPYNITPLTNTIKHIPFNSHSHSTHHTPSSTSSLHPYYYYQSSLYSLITNNTPFYSIYHYPIYYTHPL